jgi:AraC-like DNA-binding protein
MHENLAEQLTLDDLARTALFSKFHFSRVFQRITGVSPGRYLSAIRMQRAKHLLTSTSLTVTDISHLVGYASVSTFSARFAGSVGVPPTTYRRLGGFAPPLADVPAGPADQPSGTVFGDVLPPRLEVPAVAAVFVGLFPDRIPQGRPVRCAMLPGPGPYSLEDVPPGTWYLFAYCKASTEELVGYHGPLEMLPDTSKGHILVQLRPMRPLDPPVLLAVDTPFGTDAAEGRKNGDINRHSGERKHQRQGWCSPAVAGAA